MEPGMDVRGYQELQIELESRPDGLYTARTRFRDEVVEGDFGVPLSPDFMEHTLGSIWNATDVRPVRKGLRESLDPVIDMGAALYNALFVGPRELFLRRTQERASAAGHGLRLQFSARDERAAALPLEFLYDGRDFLALSARTPVVRSVVRPDYAPPAPPRGELRVLCAVNDTIAGLWLPAVAGLYDGLQRQFDNVSVKVIEVATLPRIERELAAAPYDVVHLSGYAGSGMADGLADWLAGTDPRLMAKTTNELARMFQHTKDLKLVCLDIPNSHGRARELAERVRGAAVCGIRSIVSADAVLFFYRGFLSALLSGHTLTAALTQGRQEIDRERPGSREWGLPLLHAASPDSQLALGAWQTGYGTSKGLDLAKPEPVRSDPRKAASRERQKVETWLALKRKNLVALEEQLAATSYPLPEVQEQVAVLRDDIDKLEGQLRGMN